MTSLASSKQSSFHLPKKPSLTAGVSYFLILLFASCGSFTLPVGKKSKSKLDESGYEFMSTRDYSDYLFSLKKAFLGTPGVKQRMMSATAMKYTNSLLTDIITKNEIFFRELKTAEINLIDSESPLHFSLSRGQIFLSTGLIAKYIKHESMLVSILAFELVRSEKLLYPKETLVPVGYLPLEKILLFSRLNSDEKIMIHKWAHHITVRSGYDGEYYLSWLQTQNRNTADFILQVGDANQINREEAAFKAFLIKKTNEDMTPIKKNSSKQFYAFLNSIRDGAI